jgi:hypothetical protein
MLFAFSDPEVVKDVAKEVVDLHFWTVTIWAILGTMIVGAGGTVLTAIAVYQKIATAIQTAKTALQKDIKENTDAQKQILPAVAEKVDSATKKAEIATNTAISATSAAVVIAKQVADKAESAASKVADVAAVSQKATVAAVNDLAKTIKGDDGTCIHGRLEKLEEGHAILAQGQAEIVRTVSRLADVIERKVPNAQGNGQSTKISETSL